MALAITGGNGSVDSQANTQTPQASVGPASNAAPAGRVQQGTASSLLTSGGGISLTSQVLPTVTVGNNTTTATTQSAPAQPVVTGRHHFSPVLLGLAIILFALALAFFWTTTRSAKNTTH